MMQNVIRDIGGVGIYGVISICLFFAVFSGALLWTCLQKKSVVNAMSTLPLEDDCATVASKGGPNHE